MAKYVVLTNWTNEGARAAGDTVSRADKVRGLVQSMGGAVIEIYWTLGRYDLVAITEAPDDETAAAIGVAIAGSGMVRTETLRAFDAGEMSAILAKIK